MRISSINVAQPMNHNYRTQVKHVQAQQMQVQTPAFKGVKAGAYGILGTIIGGGAAALLTGGAALLPILLGGAVGTTGGCIYGSSKEDNHGDDYIDHDPCYPNYRDY